MAKMENKIGISREENYMKMHSSIWLIAVRRAFVCVCDNMHVDHKLSNIPFILASQECCCCFLAFNTSKFSFYNIKYGFVCFHSMTWFKCMLLFFVSLRLPFVRSFILLFFSFRFFSLLLSNRAFTFYRHDGSMQCVEVCAYTDSVQTAD